MCDKGIIQKKKKFQTTKRDPW